MKNFEEIPAPASARHGNFTLKTVVIIAELLFVFLLLGLWLSIPAIRDSRNLWILFLYSFPSQFLMAVVPHEPVYFYFSKFYSPLTVTFVAVAGTVLTEYINYSVFQYFMDFKVLQKVKDNKYVQKLIRLFKKAPFLALWIAGVTPIPFYPFRFIVVVAEYPLLKYLAAVLFARSVRFYLFALFGRALNIPDNLLILFFAVLILVALLQMLQSARKWKKAEKAKKEATISEPLEAEVMERNIPPTM
ncbi:MAG: VTT domain-containing protein [Calditrichia bacterium]